MEPSARPTDPPPAPPPRKMHAGCLLLTILLLLMMFFAAVFWMIGVTESDPAGTPPAGGEAAPGGEVSQ